MKITTLVAAAALATASTAAIADNANVTTDAGEVVMIEKNQAEAAMAAWGPLVITGVIAAAAIAGGS